MKHDGVILQKKIVSTVSALLIILNFIFFAPVAAEEAGNTIVNVDDYLKTGDKFMQQGNLFQAINQYRKAIGLGVEHPDLYRNLAIALYDLGFVQDAIVEMEKAVSLAPDRDLMHLELGILYLANEQLEAAKEQFFAALSLNPGSANSYYYLGELFNSSGQYDYAWLAARMAQKLGHPGQDLIRKLYNVSREPEIKPWRETGDDLYLRQILVDSFEEAEKIVRLISNGELFEDIADTDAQGGNAALGGYAGHFRPQELQPDIANALREQEIFGAPAIVKTGEGFHIVQKIAPFDFAYWRNSVEDIGGEDEPRQGVRVIEATKHKISRKEQKVSREEPRDRGRYNVYAGSFKDPATADETVRQLRKLGFESYSKESLNGSGGLWYSVIAGTYESRQEAEAAGEELKAEGYEYFIHKE